MTGNKSQLDKFKEAARQLGTDDDEGRFDQILKEVVPKKSYGEFIDPADAPTDGQRVLFFFPDERGIEALVTGTFTDDRWVDTRGDTLDVARASLASVVGHDPDGK